MNPSRIFILRPIATALIMIATVFVGIIGYELLPISSLPQVDYPTIQVVTNYPGANPQVVTSHITAPLEKQLGQMPGLLQMTSESLTGSSIITLQFDLNLSLDIAEQEVQAAINESTSYLPDELPNPPIYNKVNPADAPIMTLAFTSNTLPLPVVEDFVDTRLSPKISEISGVGLVSIAGGQRPAIRIQVNPMQLSAHNISFENVRAVINTANVNAAQGGFDGPHLSYMINSNDQLLTRDSYRNLILKYENNAPLRLQDVATVVDAAENDQQAAWINETPAIIVNIQRQPGANVINVVDRIKTILPRLMASLPATMHAQVVTDRTLTIRSSIHDVQFELMLSIALVVLVIFLFLRNLPATFIPSITVPVSLIGTFSIMYLLNFSVNNLTLMALTISTGFIVDDAIVMIENISRYIEEGMAPIEAALKGSRQIAFTIISLTISLIAVLIPLLFMKDVIGRLFREFAMTVSVTVLISCFVSLTLTPMLCARMLRHRKTSEISSFETKSKFYFDRLLQKYDETLQWVLQHQTFILIIALITLLITGALFYIIPKNFFPPQDSGILQGISVTNPSISFDAMIKKQLNLSKIILQNPDVASVSSFIGIDSVNSTLNTGRLSINLKSYDKRKHSFENIIQNLSEKTEKIPGITLFLQPVPDITLDSRVTRTQYQYSVASQDQSELTKWNTAILNQLQHLKILEGVTSDQDNNALTLQVNIDRNTASRVGINAAMIDNTLYDAFGQRQISTMFTQNNQYHVILEAMPVFQQSPDALRNIYLPSFTNQPVPLSAITSFSQGMAPAVIDRENQFPVSLISFNLKQHAGLSDAISQIENVIQSLHIPLGVETQLEGSAKIFKSSLSNEVWLLIAAIVCVYIVLGVLYESAIHPITILSTLPSATMGALLALIISRNSLNLISLIGIILLIGIVMKNAIMMIDFALDLERRENKSPRDAIYEACLLRFRPILMTTMASMLSAVPLAFGTGMGAELRHPLGIAIIGGLIVSQLITLYTTPVIYLVFGRVSRRWSGGR